MEQNNKVETAATVDNSTIGETAQALQNPKTTYRYRLTNTGVEPIDPASPPFEELSIDVRGAEEFEQAVRLIEHHERRYEVLARVVTDPNLAAAQVDPQHLGAYVTFAGFVDRGEALHGKVRALAKGDVQIRVPVVRDADYATRVLSAVQVLGTLEHRHPHLVLADVLAG